MNRKYANMLKRLNKVRDRQQYSLTPELNQSFIDSFGEQFEAFNKIKGIYNCRKSMNMGEKKEIQTSSNINLNNFKKCFN
jgi:hypothetical protein